MADTTTSAPGTPPDEIRTTPDGAVPDLQGRLGWVRMQDSPEGGAGLFDARCDRLAVWLSRGARVVPNWPVHFGRSGRPSAPADPAAAVGAAVGGGPVPASALGAVGPADERQPDDQPASRKGRTR